MNDRPQDKDRRTFTGWLDERAAHKWVERMIRDRQRYASAFERWASAKPRRRHRYDEIVGAIQAVGIGAKLVTRAPPARAKVPRYWWFTEILATPMFATTAFLLVAGCAVYMTLPLFDTASEEKTKRLAIGNRSYLSEVGQVRTINLPDGSTVILDTDSSITVRYAASKRDILLRQGRARFEVAHDGKRPFSVFTGSGSVVATGTVFDVMVRDGFEIQLLRGMVEVTFSVTRKDMSPARTVRLRPGEKISFTAGRQAAIAEPQKIRTSDQQWVSGVKTFDDVPAREIIAEANTYSATKIEFADPNLANRLVVVQCDIRNTAEVAGKLATQFGLRIDRSHPGKLILK